MKIGLSMKYHIKTKGWIYSLLSIGIIALLYIMKHFMGLV